MKKIKTCWSVRTLSRLYGRNLLSSHLSVRGKSQNFIESSSLIRLIHSQWLISSTTVPNQTTACIVTFFRRLISLKISVNFIPKFDRVSCCACDLCLSKLHLHLSFRSILGHISVRASDRQHLVCRGENCNFQASITDSDRKLCTVQEKGDDYCPNSISNFRFKCFVNVAENGVTSLEGNAVMPLWTTRLSRFHQDDEL